MGSIADHVAALVPGNGAFNDKLAAFFADPSEYVGGGGAPDTYRTGRWYTGTMAGSHSTGPFHAGQANGLTLVPWYQTVEKTFDRIGTYNAVGGAGTAVVLRYGLYRFPVGVETDLTLITDFGTVAAMTDASERSIEAAILLEPGLYGLACAVQGTVVVTNPTGVLRGSNAFASISALVGWDAISDTTPPVTWRQSTTWGTTTGAFPSSIAWSSLVSYTSAPDVRLRAA